MADSTTDNPFATHTGWHSLSLGGCAALAVWDAEFEALDPAQEASVTEMIDSYYQQTLTILKQVVEGTREDE